ncbi:MAG: DUF5522 domain-containing protein [Acidimicrobiales bacterium]
MGAALRTGWLERPDPARFPPDTEWYGATLAAHDAAVGRGDAGYLDPHRAVRAHRGRLAARGSCCDSGCRHCPYVGAIDSAP